MGYEYKFTVDWFSNNIPYWEQLLPHLKGIECHFLEVGCYEGKATTWMLDNILLHSKSTIDVVDTFQGSDWELGMSRKGGGHSEAYNNFTHNIEPHKDKVNIHIGKSCDILKTLSGPYDFIYIDGSHRAPDVMTDAVLCHTLLKSGGVMIFDDYLWSDVTNTAPDNSPKLAIDCFYNIFVGSYDVVYHGYQVGLKKK